MKSSLLLLLIPLLVLAPPVLLAQEGDPVAAEEFEVQLPVPPAVPTDITVEDTPNDDGHAITIKWGLSADDGAGANSVTGYKIFRADAADSPDSAWEMRGVLTSGTKSYNDQGAIKEDKSDYFPKNKDFYYRVQAIAADTFSLSQVAGPVQAEDDWFSADTSIVLFFVVAFLIFTIWYIRAARQKKDLYVRPLAGIEAIDEAIGRATEMGKPTLYILGLGTAADIATIASFAILARVARKVAEYQTPILVPVYDPIVLTVAEDTVRAAYIDAGHPDQYKEDSVYFVTQSQFAYVAAVNGTMLREKPATNIYLGKFYAESLLLAETGALAGAIQIAGTDEVTQLPFFIVACDYTLIGEELYAASVYLSREPVLLGTLKAQDMAKALVVFVIIGSLVARGFLGVSFLDLIFRIPG